MAAPERLARPAGRRHPRAFLTSWEDLEARIVPALGTAVPKAGVAASALFIPPAFQVPSTAITADAGSDSPAGFTPQQVRTAYGISSITFGTIAGDGSGQTIALVDAYDDPGFVDSSAATFPASDLAQFDRQFNLPDPPSFQKLNQYGAATGLPDTDPAGPGSSSGNWEMEEALDVEWAHAIAPMANLLLIECNSSNSADLYSGVATAAARPGVSVVSLSWGASEVSGEGSWDRDFRTPGGHQGVTFAASAGDDGSPGAYPAFSPNVVAVGGTSLTLNPDGSYQGETAWSRSGGGVSTIEPEPAYQQGVQNTGHRTIPDVAFDADPATGVAIYDSYDNTGNGPWRSTGGTSLAAPSWAALIALADQGRVAEGGTTLDGATQTLPALYAIPAADFHDITSGSKGGSSAGPGYDEVTGLGTPRANLLVPDLAAYGLPDRLVVTAEPPGSVTAGRSFGLTVEIETAGGALATGATGTITISLASHPGGATLNGTLTATIHQGIATFSGLTIDRAGAGDSLLVSASGLPSLSTSAFSVTPAAPAQLVINSEPPSRVRAGSGFGLSITVEDPFGNVENAFDGPVSIGLASDPAGASLGGGLTTTAEGGAATFSGLTIDQAGTGYTIAVASNGVSTAISSVFNVTPAAPAQLVVTSAPPTAVTAGDGFGLAVSVEDSYGNLVTSFDGGVTVSVSSGPDGSLGGTPSLSAVEGVATFSGLICTAAGDGYTLQAASGDLTPATTGSLTVTPAAPAQLVLTSQPPPSITAGAGFGLMVAVEDAFGNLETGDRGTVTVDLPAGSGLGGVLTVPAIGGAATFQGLTLTRAGVGYALQVKRNSLTSATTTPFTVDPAAPTQLVIAVQPPASIAAGQGFGFTVAAEDRYGNLAAGFDGSVTVAVTNGSGGGPLGGTRTVTAEAGLARFSGLTIDQTGAGDPLQVTAGGLAAATSRALAVSPARGDHLVVTVQPPATVTAGSGFGLVVAAEDPFGNVDTSFPGEVTIGLASEVQGGPLAGTAAIAAGGGVARFSGLSMTRAGSGDSLVVSSGGLIAATTRDFTIIPAAPTQLVITIEPPDRVGPRQPFGFTVTAEDPFGNVAASFHGTVAAALAINPNRNKLGGTLTVQANQGVAAFTDATLKKTGRGYALTLTANGLPGTTTSSFKVSRRPIALREKARAPGHSRLRAGRATRIP